jgi:hypothetical protein
MPLTAVLSLQLQAIIPVTALHDGINLNVRSFPDGRERIDIVLEKGEFAMGGFITDEPGNSSSASYQTAWYS